MIILKNPSLYEVIKNIKQDIFFSEHIKNTVEEIFKDVKNEGDKALDKYTIKYDNVNTNGISLSLAKKDITVSNEVKKSIDIAFKNIEKFHKNKQIVEKIETSKGITCWKEARPIEKVGLYIPGGTAPLFSTLMMLGIPAKEAGCKEIVVCSPPDKTTGEPNEIVQYVAKKLNIDNIYCVGGAQSIAAMVYGTKSIPKVYKIFGPGNIYVTYAKLLSVQYGVSIDMPAGPSEVLVIADQTSNPNFIAADLLSQAEHDPKSKVFLVSLCKNLINKVVEQINLYKKNLSRKHIINKSLENSVFIEIDNINLAIEITNQIAPEHLIITTENYKKILPKINNAGSIFLGSYSPESAGDYASGTNHTLPTNGNAKCYSGVSTESFMKKISVQEITKKGLENISETITNLANTEGLDAHALAVNVRTK